MSHLFALSALVLFATVSSQTCNDIRVGVSEFTPSSANTASVTLTGSFITAPSYNVSGASSSFTVAFGTAVFSSNPTCTGLPSTASLTWSSTTSSATATVAGASVTIIGGTNVSWSCVGTTTAPFAPATVSVCVSTTKNIIPKCSTLPALGKEITAVTLTLVATDRVPNKVTAGIVTVVFTAATAITATSTITINTPFNYFADKTVVAAATGSEITCATACSTAAPAVGNVAVSNVAASGAVPAYGRVTVVVATNPTTASAITLKLAASTLTTGAPYVATTAGVTVSTTQDTVSAGGSSSSTASPALTVCPVPLNPSGNTPSSKSSSHIVVASMSTIVLFLCALLVL